MNILTCSDQENLKFVKTMLASLFDSNDLAMDIILCYSGADCAMLDDVKRFVADAEKKTISVKKCERPQWNYVIGLLKDVNDRILFLDSKIIVKGKIDDLYHIDLADRYMAVCDDILGRITGRLTDEIAFDEGVILINLEEIRVNNDYSLSCLSAEKLLWADWSLYDCPPGYYYLDLEAAQNGELLFADYKKIQKESRNLETFRAKYSNITKQIAETAKIINYKDGSCPGEDGREPSPIYEIFDKFFNIWDNNMLLKPQKLRDDEIRRRIRNNVLCREADGIYLDDFIRIAKEELSNKEIKTEEKKNDTGTIGAEIWEALTKDKKGGTVLFLPYKASMWDSLESVYDAAMEDEAWDVILSVIPYYDRLSANDKILKPEYMHCESDEFMERYSITDYTKLDFENKHFDMIFIHNPYDQCNYVTSVAPEFYTPILKAHTDCLVYIPYFVHDNEGVGRLSATTPGVVFSDYVIVVSEKVKQQYVQYFKEEIPEYEKKKGVGSIEKKFLVLGSPKYDFKSHGSIPEAWREKVYANGKKKTVIFLNTHLDSIMSNNAVHFFGKMRRLFEEFEKRDDVLILWRPHPLMVQTAQAINPAAVEPYLKLVDGFKTREIGIFDDTSDFQRAVGFCDICYGDGGSVGEFFRQMKKPMLYFCRIM